MKQRYLAWLLLILGMVLCRMMYLEDMFYNIDEAEYAVAADAMHHGWLPGVDLLGSTKPPGISLLFNAVFGIFGHNLAVIHIAHVVIMIGLGMLVVELAIALWGAAVAIPAAVLFWMVANTYELPGEILALNVESPGMVFALIALLLVWKKPQSRWTLLAAGLSLGAATIFRQSMLFFAAPIVSVIAFDAGRRLNRALYLVAGALTAWLPVLVTYFAAGAFGWAWDSWVRYPITYSSDAGVMGFIAALADNAAVFFTQALIPAAMAVGGGILVWRERKTRRGNFILWLLAASVLAVCAGSRFFGHYWIQLFPVVALFGVGSWTYLTSGTKNMRRLLIAAVVIGGIIAAMHFPTWRNWDRLSPPPGISPYALTASQLERQIGAFAKEHTRPDETVAVWGYCPQIYYYAERLPGVRDYLCHYTTGYSPGTFNPSMERANRPNGHPRAEEMFVEDLQKRAPKYVFDLVQIQEYEFTFFYYSLRDYPKIAEYVRQNYLPEGQIGDALIYRRRNAGDTWWPSESDLK